MLREKIRNYLSFGRRDRLGILVLLFLILLIYLLPFLLAKKVGPFAITPNDVLSSAIDTLSRREISKKAETYRPQQRSFFEGALFAFDPNTLPAEGWRRLGLNDKTIRTIDHFRTKGGRFRTKEDLKKIWGLPPAFFERVKDHIVIELPAKEKTYESFSKAPYKEKKIEVVHVNDADTTALIALPGIGSKLALRILNFRNKLGGFYSVEQVGETFGLQDSVFQKIKSWLVVEGPVQKININTATKEALSKHPYIRWNLANAIVAYRNQHGDFKSLDELKNIAVIDEATFEKIAHYLNL
jgi:competence protein ComEA